MWHDYVFCRLMPLPSRVKAFTVKRGEIYTVCVSEALDPSERFSAWLHELRHIESGDFDADKPADWIECHTSR